MGHGLYLAQRLQIPNSEGHRSKKQKCVLALINEVTVGPAYTVGPKLCVIFQRHAFNLVATLISYPQEHVLALTNP